MTDRFEIRIVPIEHYFRYKFCDYTLAVIQFDIVQDGVSFGADGASTYFGCSDTGLRKLIKAADDFLADKIAANTCLNFEVPYISGGVHYGYYFDIHIGSKAEDKYWEFMVTPNCDVEDRIIKYSCRLDRNQIKAVRDSLARQIDEFDWENCGKKEFF